MKIKTLAIVLTFLFGSALSGAAEEPQQRQATAFVITEVKRAVEPIPPPWEAESRNMEVEIYKPSIHQLLDQRTTIFFAYWVFDKSSGKRWSQYGHIFDCGAHAAELRYAQTEAGEYKWSVIDATSQKSQDFLWKICGEQIGDISDQEDG
jgi:hypothetical protein